MVGGIKRLYDGYDQETHERVWQSLFKMYIQVLRTLRGHDFEMEHAGTVKRQKGGQLQSRVDIDQETFEMALN